MSIWWTLHLRREAASVPLARRILLGTMDTAGVDPDISYDIGLALSEACANVVEHAAEAAPGCDDEYQVTARIEGDRCRVEVRDSGPGFPGKRPDAGFFAAGVFPSDMIATEPPAGGLVAAGRVPVRAADPQESGRGMFLIEALVDHVQFRNLPRGAVVSFDKALKWRDDALLN